MVKVVYNGCYGGFSLSDEAKRLYFSKKNTPFTEEKTTYGHTLFVTEGDNYEWEYDIERHDPILVEVVEELGERASDLVSKLLITEVEGRYRIVEYDGLESVEENDSGGWVYV